MAAVAVAVQGFLVGGGLILAIGAQNAFVLRQGLRREHVGLVCTTCALSDALLITAGVAGFGLIVERLPWIAPAFRLAGVAFLVVYGLRSLLSAIRGGDATLAPAGPSASSWRATLATCLAFTWLNPHVYLDTVVMLGSISSRFAGERVAFAAGAVTASFAFFFALGYGAWLLRPIFATPRAWRVLDAAIGATMLALAAGLALGG